MLRELFLNEDVTLESLYAEGWYIEHSSGGGWWFRHNETQERQEVPFWVLQIATQCQDDGMRSMQGQLKHLLSGGARYLGQCLPFTPKPKAAQKTK